MGDFFIIRVFAPSSSFINYLIAANGYGKFERLSRVIYPPKLFLKKGTFYDLDNTVKKGKFDHNLYNKWNAYNFPSLDFLIKTTMFE